MARGRKPKQDKKNKKTTAKERTKKLKGKNLGEVLETSHLGKKEKKSKLSPKEQEAKAFKKEFTKQLNYYKFLKKCGNQASKEFKAAKVALKKGNDKPAKKAMTKYCLLSIEQWVKAVE